LLAEPVELPDSWALGEVCAVRDAGGFTEFVSELLRGRNFSSLDSVM
jgi:hypothetical protein